MVEISDNVKQQMSGRHEEMGWLIRILHLARVPPTHPLHVSIALLFPDQPNQTLFIKCSCKIFSFLYISQMSIFFLFVNV